MTVSQSSSLNGSSLEQRIRSFTPQLPRSLYRLDIMEAQQLKLCHYNAIQTIVKQILLGEFCAQAPVLFQKTELYHPLPPWITETWAHDKNLTLADLFWTGSLWVTSLGNLDMMQRRLKPLHYILGAEKIVYLTGEELEQVTGRRLSIIKKKIKQKKLHDRGNGHGFAQEGVEIQSSKDLWETLRTLLSAPENTSHQQVPYLNASSFKHYFLEEEHYAVGFRFDLE